MTDDADGFCSSGRDVSCPFLCSVNFMLVFVDISPKFFKQISQTPSMFQRYLTILWVSSQSFPAGRTKFLEFTDWSCRPRFPASRYRCISLFDWCLYVLENHPHTCGYPLYQSSKSILILSCFQLAKSTPVHQ